MQPQYFLCHTRTSLSDFLLLKPGGSRFLHSWSWFMHESKKIPVCCLGWNVSWSQEETFREEFIQIRVCNSHMVSTAFILAVWCGQLEVNNPIFQPSEAWTLEASDHLLLLKDLSDFGLGFYLLREALICCIGRLLNFHLQSKQPLWLHQGEISKLSSLGEDLEVKPYN